MANMTFGVNIIPKDNTLSLGTSQNKWKINGVDDPKLTDTTYSNATTSVAGLMSATDKTKLDGIAAGAAVTSVNNQTGAISITPENISAVKKSGDTMTGSLSFAHANTLSFGEQDSRRWLVYPNADKTEFYIATQEKIDGEWKNWRGVFVAHSDGTVAINQPLGTDQGGTGARTPAAARTNLEITPANIGAMPIHPASIELTPSSGGAFIDFHYNGSTSDNTVRLMESAEGVLSIKAASDTAYYPILTTKNGVAKSGDTMTGSLTIKSANLDTSVNPSSGQYIESFIIQDKNSKRVGLIRHDRHTDGSNSLSIVALHDDPPTKTNYLQLKINSTGNATYQISDPANFRSAIGTVAKSGDTITGTLVLSNTTDASGIADNGPALVVGGTRTTGHLEMDGNEIIAKSDGTHGSTLYLNSDGGGDVVIGSGGLKIGKALDIPYGGTNATTAAAARTNLGITPANIGAVALDGSTTMTGILQTKRNIRFLSNSIPDIDFVSADGSTQNAKILYIANGGSENGRFKFREYRPNGTNYEDFNLPIPDASGNDRGYGILTSKSPVTIPQGGTNATTPDGACANIGAVKKSGDTMTGPLKWASAAALSAATDLQYFLGIDPFADGGTTHYITAANLLAAIGAVAKSGDTMSGTLTTTASIGINVTPSGARAYIYLSPQGDYASDVRFHCAGTVKWSLSSRDSSAEYFFGIFNHTNNSWTAQFFKDDTIQFAKPLPVGSGGTGATTAQSARTNLGAAQYIDVIATDIGTIYDTLMTVTNNVTATCRISATAIKILTGESNNGTNAKVTDWCQGTVTRYDTTKFSFNVKVTNGSYQYCWTTTFASRTSCSHTTVYRYAGTSI